MTNVNFYYVKNNILYVFTVFFSLAQWEFQNIIKEHDFLGVIFCIFRVC